MASDKNARVGRSYIGLSDQIIVPQVRMDTQDMGGWRSAIDQARNVNNPRRKLLYEMYENIKYDGHLQAVMNKRIMAITNKKVVYSEKGKEGEVFENIQELITHAPWFYEMSKYMQEQIIYGHSLIELIPDKGFVADAVLINRTNVKPETGEILINPNDSKGIPFRDDPVYSKYLIEVGGKKDLGLLLTASMYVVYKRGGFANWATFQEIFGMPLRVGKYNPFDDNTRKKLNEAFENAGSAAHLIIPNGTEIEHHDNNATGKADVFKDIIEVSNAEISKLFLGQTMTTDNGSSRSQSETHKEVEEDINLNDLIRNEYLLNWPIKNKLIEIGYPIAEGKFTYPQTKQIPLEKRIEIDVKVAQQVPVAEEYWYKTYGIEKPDGNSMPVKIKEKEQDPAEEKKVEKKKPKASLIPIIAQLYKSSCNHDHPQAGKKKFQSPDKIMEKIAEGIHDGKIKPGSVDPELHKWIANELFNGVTKGFGKFEDFTPGTPDHDMLAHLETNVHVFSAFKTYQELREANKLLLDEEGNIRPFSDFKREVLNISETYNVNYLQTEYNFALASSQMSSKWMNIEKNKDAIKSLKFSTVGDDRVRQAHADLDGIIKPVDDKFWDVYFPPLDCNCRCDTNSVEEEQNTDTSGKSLPEIPEMFRVNFGKEKIVFPSHHPYYKVAKEDKMKAKDVWGLDIPDRTKKKK